jgi:EAL domain-containing protein (putative c-di-GMP-specific phosphodiesterase class I)
MDSLLAAGLRPEQVLIEVTETEVITCFDQFRKVLKALRVAGMKLAIDDFWRRLLRPVVTDPLSA